MAAPIHLTKQLTAASADCIAEAQTLGAAGNLDLNGSSVIDGVAVLDTQRRVLLSSTGDDTDIVFTVYGNTQAGAPISETLGGAAAGESVATTRDFFEITRISVSGATAGNVEVGTNTVGSTPWHIANPHITPFELSFFLTGNADAAVEITYDRITPRLQIFSSIPTPPPGPVQVVLSQVGDAVVRQPVVGYRLTINDGTDAAKLTAIQSGIRN